MDQMIAGTAAVLHTDSRSLKICRVTVSKNANSSIRLYEHQHGTSTKDIQSAWTDQHVQR